MGVWPRLCVVVVAGGAAGAADGSRPFPPELVAFGPASAAPVFRGGRPNAWDRDLRERGWIVRDGERHRLHTTHPDVRVRFWIDPVPCPAR